MQKTWISNCQTSDVPVFGVHTENTNEEYIKKIPIRLIANLVAKKPFRWWNTQLVTRCWWASSKLTGHWGKSRAVSARHSVCTATPRPKVPSAWTSCNTAHFLCSARRRADIMHAARALIKWIKPILTFSPVGVVSLDDRRPKLKTIFNMQIINIIYEVNQSI